MNSSQPTRKPKPPRLSQDAKQGLKDYWEVYEKAADSLQEELLAYCKNLPDLAPVFKAMTPQAMEKENRSSLERTRKAVLDGNWEEYLSVLHGQGEGYARMGVEFSTWLDLISVFRNSMRQRLAQAYAGNQAKLLSALSGMNQLMDIGITGIGEAYLSAKEETINSQQMAIRELSTPVLKVRERFLILPIIGIIDTQRARQITEDLLRAVRNHRAKAVVMDITGVPVVDSKVANHLVQTVEAARLMGAAVIITGLSPEIAQTLVTLGAELPNVKTFGDLQGGIEEAEYLLGIQVLPREKPERQAP